MANKVIQIGDKSSLSSQNEEIYVDISMISNQNPNNSESKFKITKSVNVRAVQNSIDNIFTWIPGERILNPEFGSRVREYLYQGITSVTEEQIVVEINSCLSKYDPRVIVDKIINVSNINDTEDNTIVLDIEYHIKDLPDEIFNKQIIFNKNG